ncbi:OadG family protein [Accumulibacter sp.]|uniref:OadG family protein n=1 Tax=Accumulibacter sp. TaxID=2053492 RepID=UPI0025F6BA62|nr:OadG family protein [Accumulibacter sp.]MCM8596774.1 OadG family protein [Accumulibacter sp.]MCM8624692.1 OadG family protein [Accumulibacter sp.]MDS4050922.1 OadG family protein [Accumulibacter sp.]
MSAIVPDTLEGALILSLIDFFLSFVVISFIGFVLAGFPWLNRVFERRSPGAEPLRAGRAASPAKLAAQSEIPPEDVAAISAVLAMVVGDHRILHIESHQRGGDWSVAGRLAHHQSHTTVRTPKH